MKKLICFAAIVLATATAGDAQAGSVGTLIDFQSGQPAFASEVNSNFDAIKNAVNDNDSRIQVNIDGILLKQNRVSGTCPPGQSIRVISADGSVTCEIDSDSGAATAASVSDHEGRIADLETTVANLQGIVNALSAKLAYMSVDNSSTLNGLAPPHVIFTGANIHVQNGSGQSDTTNGVGNIIVGYNEPDNADTSKRTGSHNLVIGQRHEYSRYNGLVAGFNNRLEGVNSTVSGGYQNVAGGNYTSVSGGRSNETSARYTSVTGGNNNEAIAEYATVTGGTDNTANAFYAAVSGGRFNDAIGNFSSVSGGFLNVAGGLDSSVSGGYANSAGGERASISGGAANSAGGNYASISGGQENSAGGNSASVSGGRTNSAGGNSASVSGGNGNSAPATYQSDETPDYDSGWQSINTNNYIDFTHNLGGDVNDYTVVLEQKDTTGGGWGINNKWLGTDVYYTNVGQTRNDVGSFWVDLDTTSVRVYRNPDDISSDQVRIKIWLHKS